MKLFYKYIALALSCVMGAAAFCGCMEDPNYYEEDELPYGATMKELKTSFPVPMCFDRRFVTDEMAAAVANYYGSVQNQDTELYLQSTFPFHVDYKMNVMYEGQFASYDEFVKSLHTSIAQPTAEDFKYTMITITGLTTERVASRLEDTINMLEELSGDANFAESITECWKLEIEWRLNYNGGAEYLAAEDQELFLIGIDGTYYCVS